ncbi:Na+/H+ antiporter subunit E [Halochromatium glycolicum]|uniref:Cation:proton antiporter n=1 Tax=Halochromatium glycolicum TaxID=85075 RepID=A0AAJ0U2E0_9GAMM|nr:Na+/H+ antiporter subunit E [Halochromatium glycolicum]MBK1703600.1 cation:proton antiporter [Halochromatium glycolicum]
MRRYLKPLLSAPLSTLALLGLWLLLQGSLAPDQVLLGAGLALAITAAAHPFWPVRQRPRRPLLIARYLWRLAVDIVIANLRIAALILSPSRHPQPAFVELPLTLTEPFALYLLATTISLTPGSLSAELSDDRRLLLLHLLDAPTPADAAAECAKIKDHYERLLLEIFP